MMYCQHCGVVISEDSRFCPSCGLEQDQPTQTEPSYVNPQLVGYSRRINDPRVAAVQKKISSSGKVFTFILAIIAVIGFTVAGAAEVGDFELPSAFFFGVAIGGLLVVGGLFQMARAKRDKTWDGTVVNKTVQHPTYRQRRDGNYQTQYILHINDEYGKLKKLPATREYFDYMEIGDRVRHHGGTASFMFEKYDKSKDKIIFCIACTTKNDITNDVCRRCKCPLLK